MHRTRSSIKYGTENRKLKAILKAFVYIERLLLQSMTHPLRNNNNSAHTQHQLQNQFARVCEIFSPIL